MESFNLTDFTINEIFYLNNKKDHYGLRFIFRFDDYHLLFDSATFVFKRNQQLPNLHHWQKLDLNNVENLRICSIREDELTSYFILLSDNTLIYIYQELDGDEFWSQSFEIVVKGDEGSKYDEVLDYMNQDWVEDIIIPITQ